MRYLYVVRCTGFHKIGITKNVLKRIAEMQVGNPSEIVLVFHYGFDNPVAVERKIHSRFYEKHETGEWFKIDKPDLLEIEDICRKHQGIRQSVASLFPLQDVEIIDDGKVAYIPSTGWRIQLAGTGSGEYKGEYSYYNWVRGSGANREYVRGGKISKEDLGGLGRPGKGNRIPRK